MVLGVDLDLVSYNDFLSFKELVEKEDYCTTCITVMGNITCKWLQECSMLQFHTERPIRITPRGIIMGKGIHPTSKLNETRGFQCLGHSNWTICSPLSPFCSKKVSTFFTFILGGQFLLPKWPNNGKREFSQPQNWMRQRVFGAWGIQTVPLASLGAHFVQEIF